MRDKDNKGKRERARREGGKKTERLRERERKGKRGGGDTHKIKQLRSGTVSRQQDRAT